MAEVQLAWGILNARAAKFSNRMEKLCKLLQINSLGKVNAFFGGSNDLAFNGVRLILRGSPKVVSA